MQWSNFKPLISNSLSQGRKCLIVGDVKQSIYRWRNGDWDILAGKIFSEYPGDVLQTENLNTNWRSSQNIVEFNTSFFNQAKEKLGHQLQMIFGTGCQNAENYLNTFRNIYSDLAQTLPETKKSKGSVFIRSFSRKNNKESSDYFSEQIIKTINSLLEKGYAQGDIALLVREKKEGKFLADLLNAANDNSMLCTRVNVISEDSLFLSASNATNMLIAALQCLNAPEEEIYLAKLMCAYKAHLMENLPAAEEIELNLDAGFFDKKNVEMILPADFLKFYKELSALPLYELLEQLVIIFQAYTHHCDVPYIHALLNLVHEYSMTNSPGIQGFLDYWMEEGQTKSIPASELQQAIRILTIHKAKGLEFPVVFLPFCNWDLNQKPNSIFWVRPPEGRFDFLPVLPLNYTKTLQDSCFSEDYYLELFKSHIDNLNLLYVAFTRAAETLIVFFQHNESGESQSKIKTVGDLVCECISKLNGNNVSYTDPSEVVYQAGSFEHDIQPDTLSRPEGNFISHYSSKSAISRIYFNPRGYEYFKDTLHVRDKRIRGRVLHQVLSKMKTHNDIEKTVKEAVLEGLISENEGDSLKEHILMVLSDPTVKTWFNGSGEVITERDIILPDGNNKRPDRVVIWNDKIHVIDYKFSHEQNNQAHREQVRDYTIMIAEMEEKNIEGYLWYVDTNTITKI
jgi:ATP-dependent exoDNAse (exonuclease V) beta subunit